MNQNHWPELRKYYIVNILCKNSNEFDCNVDIYWDFISLYFKEKKVKI